MRSQASASADSPRRSESTRRGRGPGRAGRRRSPTASTPTPSASSASSKRASRASSRCCRLTGGGVQREHFLAGRPGPTTPSSSSPRDGFGSAAARTAPAPLAPGCGTAIPLTAAVRGSRRRSRWQQQESCTHHAGVQHEHAWRMAGDVAEFTARDSTFTAVDCQRLRVWRQGLKRRPALRSADTTAWSASLCGSVLSPFHTHLQAAL